MDISLGSIIAKKRRTLGYTQQNLAEHLNVTYQAVSKWENGFAMPDISLLPKIAYILETSVDALLGYSYLPETSYEEKYKNSSYYWGNVPNSMCYEIMKLRPPVKPYNALDIGCGEGKDAVFLAKNGYRVFAFDVADSGLEKARKLAEESKVHVNFFKANIYDYKPEVTFDIIFSSGVFHYITPEYRREFVDNLKKHTAVNGINAINVFVDKPFIPEAPDEVIKENEQWHSGEIFSYYHEWRFHKIEEKIFDCNSNGSLHQHCMDILIAEKITD